jgi:cytochrome c-type biogenesis protein CcmH
MRLFSSVPGIFVLATVLAPLSVQGVLAEASPVQGHSVQQGERARWLAGRLIAPCCWTQTLDIHDSELSTALRLEIATRLAQGESGEAIEGDFALRYGEKIRAVPAGADPRMEIVAGVGLLMLLSVGGLFLLGRRFVTRAKAERDPAGAEPIVARDAYDADLDAELLRLRT